MTQMKSKLLFIVTLLTLVFFPGVNFAQAPALGSTVDFVLFTSVGAVSNTGISHITGSVGTNSGSSTAFGNVDGVMNDNNGVSAAASADLLTAYNQLNATVPTIFPGILLGNGQILNAGVHGIPAAATMNLDLILDAQGVPSAVFIIKIAGPLSTNAGSKVKLVNGAKACNVYWQVEGLLDMAAGTTMRGTLIVNNAGINMNAGDSLEGRALSTNGAITISNSYAHTPIGCGSVVLTGPNPPALGAIACYTIFSADGPVTNVGITYVTGDVGSNLGLTTGFNPLFVTGAIHPIPDASTAACATDLNTVYNYLNLLPYDIELLYPAQFGNELVLTPHTYLMNAAVTFTDTLYLDAQGNPNAVFVFLINGALNTSVYSKVVLRNGAQSQNIFWKVEGAVSINDYSIFKGSIICNNGAINLNTGMSIDGRALSTVGAVNTAAIMAIAAPGCGTLTPPNIIIPPNTQTVCVGDSVSFIVSATGVGLSYQWRKGNVNMVDGGNISGATTDTLTINPVSLADAGNNYNVIIYGTYSPNDTSSNVSLIIAAPPLITADPLDQGACIGDSVSFQVAATGAGLTYQWRRGLINLVNSGNISGVNSPILTIDPVAAIDFALDYNVVVSGTCSPADVSLNAALAPSVAPVIVLDPASQIVCAGDSVSFLVVATGTGITYQWRKGNINLINSASISGVNSPMLTIDPASVSDAANNYNVIVIGACTSNDTSVNFSLTVNAPPVITTGPVTQFACPGDSISFQVTATGTNLTYQWRKGIVNLVNAGNISGATTSTLSIDPATATDAANNYNVIISGACMPADTSLNVSLIMNTPPVITTEAVNMVACEGTTVSLSVTATGTALTYQWRKGSVNMVNAGNISGATSSTLTFSPVGTADAAVNYNVIVSGTCLPNDTSLNVSLTVNSTPVAVASSNSPDCIDSTIIFAAQAVTGATYSWTGPNGFTSNNQNPIITPATLADSGFYALVVSANGCVSSPDVIFVSVDSCIVPDFHIPDGFSPNGDGTNDLFVIRGILNFPGNTFMIYNRWGNKVFEANPYTNTWDGKSDGGLSVGGDQLPVGTYFYVLDLGDGTPVYKGTIYLNR